MQNEELFVGGQKAGWTMIDVIRKHFDLGYDYVMYTDVDWLFLEMEKSIEDLISVDPEKHVFVSWECLDPQHKQLMQGTLIMRNSDVSRSFLDEWESLKETELDDEYNHSQVAFGQMLKTPRSITDPDDELFGFGPIESINLEEPGAQQKIERWDKWAPFFHVFDPKEFMTYPQCVDPGTDLTRSGHFGMHFPARGKVNNMKQVLKQIAPEYYDDDQALNLDITEDE